MTSTHVPPPPASAPPPSTFFTTVLARPPEPARPRTLRPALIDWIVRRECTWALTLNPNRGLGLATELELLRRAFRDADEALLGSRFNRIDGRKRLLGFVFAEHVETNLHFHLAVRPGSPATRAEEEARCVLLSEIWKYRVASGSCLLKPMSDAAGWGSYISKEFRRADFDFWTSSMWWPERQRRHVLDRSWEPPALTRSAIQ